jgi:hypothetical protein
MYKINNKQQDPNKTFQIIFQIPITSRSNTYFVLSSLTVIVEVMGEESRHREEASLKKDK